MLSWLKLFKSEGNLQVKLKRRMEISIEFLDELIQVVLEKSSWLKMQYFQTSFWRQTRLVHDIKRCLSPVKLFLVLLGAHILDVIQNFQCISTNISQREHIACLVWALIYQCLLEKGYVLLFKPFLWYINVCWKKCMCCFLVVLLIYSLGV